MNAIQKVEENKQKSENNTFAVNGKRANVNWYILVVAISINSKNNFIVTLTSTHRPQPTDLGKKRKTSGSTKTGGNGNSTAPSERPMTNNKPFSKPVSAFFKSFESASEKRNEQQRCESRAVAIEESNSAASTDICIMRTKTSKMLNCTSDWPLALALDSSTEHWMQFYSKQN